VTIVPGGSAVHAVWLPYEVDDVDGTVSFFTDHLGLSVVDSWDRSDERGTVLKVADAAYLELASPGAGALAPIAFELASAAAVDAAHRLVGQTPRRPRRFPRGHYGFAAASPVGPIMVWSER
jgi:catechol 2,3-dioxygenase-like lactoylglutathione lyase family enzyme